MNFLLVESLINLVLIIRDSAEQTDIVFLRIQACLFPTIASTGLNGSKTEASSNILSQTVTCKCEDKRR